jgi:hypothetical protein
MIKKIFRPKKDGVSEHFRMLCSYNEEFVICTGPALLEQRSRGDYNEQYIYRTRKIRNACRILVMKS